MSNLDAIDTRFLDECATHLRNYDDVPRAIQALGIELHRIRSSLAAAEWKRFVVESCRPHPLLELVHEDPLARRVYTKPRGYPGDAVMLDFIYAVEDGGELPALTQASVLGQHAYAINVRFEAAEAVRERRRIIAKRLDRLAMMQATPEVFSLACGHLREAQLSEAMQVRAFGRFVAVDSDAQSVDVVEREYGSLGVEARVGSVRDILRGKLAIGTFDFIYTAGLYDYLALSTAERLTELLFAMLKPGGRMLIANCLPGIASAAYMEAYMDWWLIFRTKPELLQLAQRIAGRCIGDVHIFAGANQNIAYIEIERSQELECVSDARSNGRIDEA